MIIRGWNNAPVWLKVILAILFIWGIVTFLDSLVKLAKTSKKRFQKKLGDIQFEVHELLREKKRIEFLIKKVQRYSKLMMVILKSIFTTLFIIFVSSLILLYNMDLFTAIVTAGGTVGTVYILVSWVLNIKIKNLKEFDKALSRMIELRYYKKMSVEPKRLIHIENRVQRLRREATYLEK